MSKAAQIVIILLMTMSGLFAAEYFVDSRSGSDTAVGSIDQPFLTIQKAAQVMSAGDICYVREGIYRETVRPTQSGSSGSPIRFEAYNGESVYITGANLISGWQSIGNGIVAADLPAGAQVSQLFLDWKQMEVARFPNNESENLLSPTLGSATAATAVAKPALSSISDPLLGQTSTDLTGNTLWLLSGLKWISFTMPIVAHQGDQIQFVFPENIEPAYQPEIGSDYFITGSLELLDAEKEWFFDSGAHRLYFYPPAGTAPEGLEVQGRSRRWGLDLTGRTSIEFKNINFFAAGINLDNAKRCIVESSRILYPTPFFPTDGWAFTESPQGSAGACVRIGGQENKLLDCEVAYSWGDGVTVYSDGNIVENCLIHDFAWVCSDAAGVHTSGRNHKITHNSIYNGARSGLVHRKSMGLEIAYNNIYDCGLMCTDLGATYCYNTDGAGTVIHHNWVHDVVTEAHTAGIYIDNGSSNFIVHHNVVWNTDDLGIQTNLDATNHEIYNNTLWNCAEAMGGGGGTVFKNQKVYNNLSNANKWFGTDVRQNLILGDARFVDEQNHDFRLQADSPARDDYVLSSVFLNGGFESGTGGWNGAGSTLESVTDPVHSGNRACRAFNRHQYWEGVRQDITEVLKDHGRGSYTIEAWVMLASGVTEGYLRFKLVDDNGDSYPGTNKRLSTTAWTKLSLKTNLNWKGNLKEAVFELMTSNDTALPDLFIDDCNLITPAAADTTKPRGGILIPGITDDVRDGKPDAGAYEYGGADADWKAGSTIKPLYSGIKEIQDKWGNRPSSFSLAQNYPNPFNGSTTIHYTLASPANVTLEIYNILGGRVATLIPTHKSAGEQSITWDGRDQNGSAVGSGVYVYRIQVEQHGKVLSENKKMVYVR